MAHHCISVQSQTNSLKKEKAVLMIDPESLSTLELFPITLCYELFFQEKNTVSKFKILEVKILTTGMKKKS
jgi:hypothetical protein